MPTDINPQNNPQVSEPPKVYPLGSDAIAWHLILLGQDCGLDKTQMAHWLMRLAGFPMWPPPDQLAVLMRDAGYE